ncbi:hypothetical protein BOX15_Mlig019603g1, partial [Macrostomum lignano]
ERNSLHLEIRNFKRSSLRSLGEQESPSDDRAAQKPEPPPTKPKPKMTRTASMPTPPVPPPRQTRPPLMAQNAPPHQVSNPPTPKPRRSSASGPSGGQQFSILQTSRDLRNRPLPPTPVEDRSQQRRSLQHRFQFKPETLFPPAQPLQESGR